jgi:hypothetical protein
MTQALRDIPGELEGFANLDRLLRRMPQSATVNLHRALRANMFDLLRAVEQRSTGFRPQALRGIVRSFHVVPGKNEVPKKLEALEADVATFWKGDHAGTKGPGDPAKGVPRRIEKKVGNVDEVRPVKGTHLAIPAGVLRTPQGAVKGRGRARVQVADVPNTHLQFSKRSRTLLVLERRGGRKADRSSRASFYKGAIEGKGKGHHERLVGILVPKARVHRNLDFFGSWQSLNKKRDERYKRLLDDVAAGRLVNRLERKAVAVGRRQRNR